MAMKEEVFEYRMRNLLTQKQLANLCGVSHITISRIENGENISHLTAARIEKVMKSEVK